MALKVISAAVLDALRTTVVNVFDGVYETTPTWYQNLATEMPSESRSNTYPIHAMQTRLRQWVGPRVAQNLAEHAYVLPNLPFEGTIELSKYDIEDDNLGVFTNWAIPDLAEAAKKHPDDLLAQLLFSNSGAGAIGFDGVTLFNDAHPTYAPTGFTQTYDNNFTATFDATGISSVYAAMTSIVGENGYPLMVKPNTLIVPPALEFAAKTIANSTFYPQLAATNVVDNPFKGTFNVIVIPELQVQPTVWYMADLSKRVKPFIYQTRSPYQVVARDNPQDPKVFEQAVFTYGVDGRDNVGVGLPWLIAKAITS